MDGFKATRLFVRLARWRAISLSSFLSAEFQRNAVRPTEAVLVGVFSATRPSTEIGDVVFLRLFPVVRYVARLSVSQRVRACPRRPRGRSGVSPPSRATATAANRGRIPLLPGPDVVVTNPPGLRKSRSRRAAMLPLLRRREPKVERRGRRERRTVRHAISTPPANVVEKPSRGIVRRGEERAAAVVGQSVESRGSSRVTWPPSQRPERRDRSLRVIQKAVEVNWDQVRSLERAQVGGVAHPPTREIPAAFGRRAHISIEHGALRLGERVPTS